MPANDDRDRYSVLAGLYPGASGEMADIVGRMFGGLPEPETQPNGQRLLERKRAREEWEERRRERRA